MSGLILLNALLDAQIFVVTLVAPQIDLVQVALFDYKDACAFHARESNLWLVLAHSFASQLARKADPLPTPPPTKSVKQLKRRNLKKIQA